jgi:hypothetical protein
VRHRRRHPRRLEPRQELDTLDLKEAKASLAKFGVKSAADVSYWAHRVSSPRWREALRRLGPTRLTLKRHGWFRIAVAQNGPSSPISPVAFPCCNQRKHKPTLGVVSASGKA